MKIGAKGFYQNILDGAFLRIEKSNGNRTFVQTMHLLAQFYACGTINLLERKTALGSDCKCCKKIINMF